MPLKLKLIVRDGCRNPYRKVRISGCRHTVGDLSGVQCSCHCTRTNGHLTFRLVKRSRVSAVFKELTALGCMTWFSTWVPRGVFVVCVFGTYREGSLYILKGLGKPYLIPSIPYTTRASTLSTSSHAYTHGRLSSSKSHTLVRLLGHCSWCTRSTLEQAVL